jgi:YVTN family beta-propeller protein
VAVNPITNKIYVANSDSNNLTVINGTSNATSLVITGVNPDALAVNPITNKIYVANFGSASGSITVIDGRTLLPRCELQTVFAGLERTSQLPASPPTVRAADCSLLSSC